MARRRSPFHQVTVDIDVDDVLDQLDDDSLLEVCEARGIKTATHTKDAKDDLRDALEAIQQHRLNDATAIIERILWPKFADVEACMKQYKTFFGTSQ